MKLTNTSAYHTATLRRIFTVTVKALCAAYHTSRVFDVRVLAEEGRKHLHWSWDTKQRPAIPAFLRLTLPKLTGAEFIPLLRQQHGGEDTTKNVDHAALRSTDVAMIVQQIASSFYGWRPVGSWNRQPELSVRAALVKAKVPQYIPLRIRTPPKEEGPRDIVSERYERVLELETKWKTKQKLAQTKLKTLRLKRRHYEKTLAKRNLIREN